jgi:hypothetical protein
MGSLNIQFLVLMLLVSGSIQAQWVRTNGPNGGYVDDLAANGNTVFAATTEGIYRSDDNGQSWISISDIGASQICVKRNVCFCKWGIFRISFDQQITVMLG